MPENQDDLSPISNCPPNQRSGIRLTFPFFVPCGCWDDLLIPVGGFVSMTLKKLLKSGLREVAEKKFARVLLRNRLGKLGAKSILAKKTLEKVQNIYEDIYFKLKDLNDRWSVEEVLRSSRADRLLLILLPQRSLESTIHYARQQIQRIRSLRDGWVQTIRDLEARIPGQTYFPGWHLGRNQYILEYGTDYPEYAILRQKEVPQYYTIIQDAATAKRDIEKFKETILEYETQLKQLQTKNGKEIQLLERQIKEHIKKQKILEAQINASRPQIPLGAGRIVPAGTYDDQLDYLLQQQDELEAHIDAIKRLQDRASTTVPEKLNQAIDNAFPDIASTMLAVLIDILTTFTLVGPHECRPGEDGAILNTETCKCDICPPDKQLCEPIVVDPGIRLPYTAIADSANYCLEPCCFGFTDELGDPLRVYKPSTIFTGGITELLGVPQCACRCPTDKLGQEQILRPCVTSVCDDGYTCASDDFPDDICTTLRLFSKFYWYDGSDPAKSWCGFRCKNELSDSDCFSLYGSFTKWDTRNAYCSCICEEKSNTDCPEKATYTVVDNYHLPPDFTGTYCDLLENPIEPQCTCVCEDRECPPGQILNRSITGENACECVPDGSSGSDGSGLSFIGQKTYYFDTESSSWKMID